MTTIVPQGMPTPTAPVTASPEAVNPEQSTAAIPAVQDEQLSPKFAALAKREQDLRKAAQAFKAQQAAFQAQQDAIKAKEAEYQANYIPKDSLKANPLEALSQLGYTQDQMIQMILNGPKQVDPELMNIQNELKAIKAQQEASTKAAAEQQTKAYEQAVNQIRNEATMLVDSDERFETIKETGSQEAVVTLIEETYKTTGLVMKTEEAAKQVEEYLVEEAFKMAGLKKVQARLSPPVPVIPGKQLPTQKQVPQTKTLTNAATVISNSRPRTERERIERAKLAFRGELPQ